MEVTQPIGLAELSAMADTEDRARFADLVTRQSRFVFRVAYAVVRNAADAEDVVQDTFLKLHRTGAWLAMEDECAFLARTAWRLAVDRLPRRRPGPELVESVASHEQALIDHDQCAWVHRLIDALPDELRQPLVLSSMEELTSPQIAELLDIPAGTVRTRIMRARQILKEKIRHA